MLSCRIQRPAAFREGIHQGDGHVADQVQKAVQGRKRLNAVYAETVGKKPSEFIVQAAFRRRLPILLLKFIVLFVR